MELKAYNFHQDSKKQLLCPSVDSTQHGAHLPSSVSPGNHPIDPRKSVPTPTPQTPNSRLAIKTTSKPKNLLSKKKVIVKVKRMLIEDDAEERKYEVEFWRGSKSNTKL